MSNIENRYDFVYFFEVTNGNPNGDPDAGNLPRVDVETGLGITTDVSLKRKVRNYVTMTDKPQGEDNYVSENSEERRYNIYIKEASVLNRNHDKAHEAVGSDLREKSPNATKGNAKTDNAKKWLCNNFYDIRTFGAVMNTGAASGVVRGPVQFTFSQSVEPVMPTEISVTRMAVTKEEDLQKERTIGKKTYIPYGLYRMEGFISANQAAATGFTQEDLDLLWESLINMFEQDHSASRGKMGARKLIVFKHESKLGNAPAQTLFDLVRVKRLNDKGEAVGDVVTQKELLKDLPPARYFADYKIEVESGKLPSGVVIEEKL
ncbi:MAG: type I-C CRISPR-associated protein Cas7/Csd2 [Spirochaetaceae bacterium]|nr:type I-C CRISPR-associated protein Cas7/Csd2 [Spirochaetaceae bacterium]